VPVAAHAESYVTSGRSFAFDGPRYYGVHLSDNIAETPEGFRVCRNAVIGRSGFQKYRISELTDPDGLCKDFQATDEVNVWRDPAEVFSPATLASFEGKDFTILHPDELVTPDTHRRHSVGHITNVRRGTEALDDGNWPMLADIIVKDRDAISAIDNGARELSCGYAYKLRRDGQLFQQTEIVGNHVALVPKGRAGSEARINDSEPVKEWAMNIKDRMKQIWADGFKSFAKDAKPEELAEVIAAATAEETTPKLVSIGKTPDGVEVFRYAKDCGDSNPAAANPAMDQKAKDRKALHDALDSKLDEEEKAAAESGKEKDAAMDKLKGMFGAKDEEHPADCDCADCKAKKAGDGEIEESRDETTGEPIIPPAERQESQFDAAATVLDALKPFVAESKDKRLKAAFDTASQRVAAAKSKVKDGKGGSYAGFRTAAQRVGVDAAGKFEESSAQKMAREMDEMFAKERAERSKAYAAKR
jgi:hypothetical protein